MPNRSLEAQVCSALLFYAILNSLSLLSLLSLLDIETNYSEPVIDCDHLNGVSDDTDLTDGQPLMALISVSLSINRFRIGPHLVR